jgi:glyoxylase-like metal-dependent hydrolase (beta-lactamase superfamily II)
MEEKHFGPVWFIPGKNGGRYPYCHSIYIEGEGILIDPASDRKRLKQLRDNPGVKRIWLSHWHEDHIMHLDLFDDLPLHISEPDAPPISDINLFMDAYDMDVEEERKHWEAALVKDFHFKPRTPSSYLVGEKSMAMDGVTIEIMSTPGHTPGSLSFFFREVGVLFMGDYDLSKFGPWYGDLESSIEDTISSVQRLRKIPAKAWITGHETGLFEEEPGEAWDRYLSVIERREGKLLNFLEEPRTLEDIVGAWIVYGKPKEPKSFFEFGERVTMKKHLQRLMMQGVVKLEGEKYHKL